MILKELNRGSTNGFTERQCWQKLFGSYLSGFNIVNAYSHSGIPDLQIDFKVKVWA